MNASNRADKLMLTPMNDVPAPAIAYARYLGKKYGMCGEVYMTAFAHFAECFEGAEKSNDSLYVANDEARAFFAGYRAADSQRPTGDDIVDTLREALAQPEQEPYAYTAEGECWSCRFTSKVDTEFRLKALNIPLEKLRYLYLHPTPIPEGWVMVPKEPTAAMDFAGAKAADEIERLEKENESLKASVYGLYELEKELYEIQAREAKLREALNTTLGCVDVYYIPALKDEFALADAPYDDTALKEFKRKVLLGAADELEDNPGRFYFDGVDELRRMAEE